ncbi:hypothetical protein FEZ41_10075 [Lentilactobacillus parafarraginis]|jgi:mannose/fructose/N-acetylgalactosamine-specific phosphotransferase system component IID|uniref:Uncharacterized protein n=2 Tax=Lentilactobacillus parafarraginis TaxID=390842 RepID=A0A0R1YTL8_9LACO|nr:hypothetical protein [Lentilactobacillus parafarraginis]KRM44084.1 hypothetical protein FD47_GL000956 [Lentilactobacillus parafarraginis DSM 18390 = JCM 14109]TLQ18089.1 hypothetical protein FEZ41_10075 [Lentilactobacillus parafarraginis]
MDENLRITLIGMLTLIIGTIFASVVASFGITSVIPGLLSFLIAAALVTFGFRFTNHHHLASKH